MKELQIVAPEGYEVDKEKSTFEKIVFKEKSGKPMSWEEFCETKWSHIEYFIGSDSKISWYGDPIMFKRLYSEKNYCKTQEEAEAFLAFIQLRRLWHEWKDGKPCKQNPVIYSFKYQLDGNWGVTFYQYSLMFPIWFYSEETAKLFLNTFKDLFNKVKILYE